MYLTRTPAFVKEFFPQLTWELPGGERVIYLTFDDGPHPAITPRVLSILENYQARGTFFCVGENIVKYPDTFRYLKEKGQGIGSHTFNHLNGWATDNITYFKNIRKAATLTGSSLFRPPYGRIRPSQVTFVHRHYQIIMWSVLSGDFDKTVSTQKCFENVRKSAMDGSIVVFHDSDKAAGRMLDALPRVLDYFTIKGFRFEALPQSLEYLAMEDVSISF